VGVISLKISAEIPGDLDTLLSRARNGDGDAREKLIEGCRRFIEKRVACQTYNSPDIKSRDEYSIGLMAFNEAIDKFNPGHNRAFLSFASDLIKMRIIDYYRKNKAEGKCLPFSAFECSEEISYTRPPTGALDPVGERVERECELDSFLNRLKEFKISLEDLVKNTPRHRDSRLLSIKVARIIASDPELMGDLHKKKTIPLKKVLDKIKINPKTVERHRKYIISICLVLTSDMETLKEYIEQTEKEGSNDGL